MIIADNISKSFGDKKSIDSLSFHVPHGETVGFIGANGAGKSTTIKMLTGALLPDSGIIRVAGIDPWKNRSENLRNIAFVGAVNTQLWKDMKLSASFELCRTMYKLSKTEFQKNMEYLSEKLELSEILNYQVINLSLGQRMRAEIAYAFLHNPKVLYLDEGTIGLDVIYKEKVINLINEVNKERGTTIFFASNNLKDIENTCRRIVVIDKGKKIYEGDLLRFKKQYAGYYLLKAEIEGGKIPDFQDLPIKKYTLHNNELFVYYENNAINSPTLINHIISQCTIKDIKIIEPDLEDIIRNIYAG